MIVLGINAYHGDASACIFKDNELVAAIEEERLNRVKHSAGLPINSIKFCLKQLDISLSQVNHIAINRNPRNRILSKVIYSFRKLAKFKFIKDRISNLKRINSLKDQLEKQINDRVTGKINFIDHHDSHIASSVYFSGFKNCDFISVDGFGDFASTIIGNFDGKKFNKTYEVLFPHSLGLFYTAVTQFLGFNKYGDEYKVMGLAPYGKPLFYDKMKEIIYKKKKQKFRLNLDYFIHHKEGVEMTWLNSEPNIGRVYSNKFNELLGDERKKNDVITIRHKNIASSAQKIYEDIFFEIINDLNKNNKSENLCISGGCAMNSVANGKIKLNTSYKKIYIPPAPGDSGGAIGAASLVINNNSQNTTFKDNPYLGPKYNNNEIFDVINKFKKQLKDFKIEIKKFEKKEDLLILLAKKISENKIIGFFNERMEWGPRALGNRSILANPTEKNMREIINQKIKRRESFRPFAPSILREYVNDWFEQDEDVPFMSQVLQVKPNKRSLIPAVTHVDGSGRLQTVDNKINPNFYELINKFFLITNIPMVLNTSFNENEPIVCTPEEAINCFLRTDMDCLSLENYLLYRKN